MAMTVLFVQRTGRSSTRSDAAKMRKTSEVAIMDQSPGMAVATGASSALQSERARRRRTAAALFLSAIVGLLLVAPLAARAANDEAAEPGDQESAADEKS